MIFKYFLAIWFLLVIIIQTLIVRSSLKLVYHVNDYEGREMFISSRELKAPITEDHLGLNRYSYVGYIVGEDTTRHVKIPFIPEKHSMLYEGGTVSVWYREASTQVFLKLDEDHFYGNYQMKRLPIVYVIYIASLIGFYFTIKSIIKHHKRKRI